MGAQPKPVWPSPCVPCAWPTTITLLRKRERPGCRPVSQLAGADGAEQESLRSILCRLQTDRGAAMRICALCERLSVTASVLALDAGDGLRSTTAFRMRSTATEPSPSVEVAMSHAAIAAAVVLPGASTGERLTALSLVGFAGRNHRCWPGARVAAARAVQPKQAQERQRQPQADDPSGGSGCAMRQRPGRHEARTPP